MSDGWAVMRMSGNDHLWATASRAYSQASKRFENDGKNPKLPNYQEELAKMRDYDHDAKQGEIAAATKRSEERMAARAAKAKRTGVHFSKPGQVAWL